MTYRIIYDSRTGNTEKLAFELFNRLPIGEKVIASLSEWKERTIPSQETSEDIYFAGFWTNRGSCSAEMMGFLSQLHEKSVVLFGTCGMGNDPDYYRMIAHNVEVFLPDDAVCMGTFLCQGKMPIQVRKKYEAMEYQEGKEERARHMMRVFDEALLHPNQEDFEKLNNFLKKLSLRAPIDA